MTCRLHCLEAKFLISLPLVNVYVSKVAWRPFNLYRSYGFGEWLKKTASPHLLFFFFIFLFLVYVKPLTCSLTKQKYHLLFLSDRWTFEININAYSVQKCRIMLMCQCPVPTDECSRLFHEKLARQRKHE